MKIKIFIKHFLLSFLLILFSLSAAFSQYSTYVEPSTVQATADEIEELFGDLLNVSNADLVNAMQQMLTNFDVNAGLVPPDPTVLGIQNNYISFDWQDIPNAGQYKMRYLDVETGQTGEQSYSPGASPHVLQVPNSLLMLMVNSSNSIGASRIRVDFVEMDIVLRPGPCNCDPDPSDPYDGGGYDEDVAWNVLADNGALQDYLEYDLVDGESFDLVFKEIEGVVDVFDPVGAIKTIHGFKSAGDVYINYGLSCSMDELGEWGVTLDIADFGAVVFTGSFEVSLSGIMKMATNKCQSAGGGRHLQEAINPTQPQATTKLSPNPVKTHLSINLPDNNANGVKEIRVFSLSGVQVVHQQVREFESSLNVSMSHLNPGIYLVELISSDNVEKRTIIKMD